MTKNAKVFYIPHLYIARSKKSKTAPDMSSLPAQYSPEAPEVSNEDTALVPSCQQPMGSTQSAQRLEEEPTSCVNPEDLVESDTLQRSGLKLMGVPGETEADIVKSVDSFLRADSPSKSTHQQVLKSAGYIIQQFWMTIRIPILPEVIISHPAQRSVDWNWVILLSRAWENGGAVY